jgi:hypothetical protein
MEKEFVMKKAIVVILTLVMVASFAFSQETVEKKAFDAGLRLGPRPGFNARMFLSESSNIEALFTFRSTGMILTGMYQFGKPLNIFNIEGLRWYVGGGIHAGWWAAGSSFWIASLSTWDTDVSVGIDLIAGLEYSLEPWINFPLSLSIDYKPGINFFGQWAGTLADFSFSLRYTF